MEKETNTKFEPKTETISWI